MEGVSLLPVPVIGDLVTRWTLQPVALAAAVDRGRLVRLVGRAGWPVPADATAVAAAAHRSSSRSASRCWSGRPAGSPRSTRDSLYWVWTSQQLILLLLVPVMLMAGQPIELARRTRGERALPVRFVDSRAGRLFANPLVGPVLIPALSVGAVLRPACRAGRSSTARSAGCCRS